MSTAERLGGMVHYHTSNPHEYTDATVGASAVGTGFRQYKVLLNDHLKGERGDSTLALLFESRREAFDPSRVKMGLTASCPMSLRREIIAQHDYRSNENRSLNGLRPASTDSIRVTNLMAGTLGMVISLTYRLIRAIVRTAFAIITIPYAYHQQQRYGIEGWAKEDAKRIVWEWIDVGTTLVSFAGVINTFHPNAIKLDSLRDYYITRTDEAIARNQEFARAKQTYLQERARTRAEEM